MAIKTINDLKTSINDNIKVNGVRSINGAVLNTEMIDTVDSIVNDYESADNALDARVTGIENLTLKILQDPLTGWDVSTGVFPSSGTTKAGYYWNVSVAGTINSVEFDVGDSVVALIDNPSTTTYAGNWFKEDNVDRVLSVNSKIGAVVVDKTDVGLSNVTNTDFTSAVALNTAKVTNATHTGEVTGSTALTVDVTAISNKPAIAGALAGTEEVLVNASGLKKVTAQQLRDLKSTSFDYEVTFNEVLDVLQRFPIATNITDISAYNVATLNYSINDAADVLVALPFSGTIALAANDRIVWKITYTTGTLAVLNLTATEL